METTTNVKFIPQPPKFAIILCGVLALFWVVLSVDKIVDIKNGLEVNTITVSGEGKVISIPDVASISFSVISDKMTAKEAMSDNSQKMNAVIKSIKDLGVASKDLKTTGYNLAPLYDWPRGQRIFKGYELTSTLSVKIRDFDKISDIIDGAIMQGANQAGDIQFVVDKPEILQAEARDKAIQQAKDKAAAIAKASGFKLGKVVSFSESGTDRYYPQPMYAEKSLGAGDSAMISAPAIESGSQEIQTTVSLVFRIR
ncbi:MAG: SIMPL domain-containing protein [Patescibacteria group bacterium]|nr:SIMPL domain-containing protein [Patescibacteria group bacterium]MDD5164725.1 SIMPL domain-containing protein [Patescibacteria group bacterium]MDD5534558.1 SIMPL domain-containing protein [Patescibacteria group bacterium]